MVKRKNAARLVVKMPAERLAFLHAKVKQSKLFKSTSDWARTILCREAGL
jgi:hypothetical protein